MAFFLIFLKMSKIQGVKIPFFVNQIMAMIIRACTSARPCCISINRSPQDEHIQNIFFTSGPYRTVKNGRKWQKSPKNGHFRSNFINADRYHTDMGIWHIYQKVSTKQTCFHGYSTCLAFFDPGKWPKMAEKWPKMAILAHNSSILAQIV